ncbi:hypothetical protein MMC08_003842 [Hypocenomyce scalaris]|nr:hypothetical protein [Hypocenomyce scalaris]
MNRSEEIFGENANEFRPERIGSSEKEDEAIKEMSRSLTTFGMGSRVCVGQNIALVEIHKFISQFVRHFDLKLINTERPWVTKSQWVSFQSEFCVKMAARDHEKTRL